MIKIKPCKKCNRMPSVVCKENPNDFGRLASIGCCYRQTHTHTESYTPTQATQTGFCASFLNDAISEWNAMQEDAPSIKVTMNASDAIDPIVAALSQDACDRATISLGSPPVQTPVADPVKEQERCGNCRFWFVFESTRPIACGHCHRKSPPIDKMAQTWWPLVKDTDWCGEWRAKA